MALNLYNRVAPWYESLAKLVFGSALLRIQKALIQELPTQGTLAILGGGTGHILPYLYAHAPQLHILYAEASEQMIQIARKNAPPQMLITFMHTDNLEWTNNDITGIYAGFFFDLFAPVECKSIISDIEDKCPEQLTWYVADFDKPLLKQASFLRKAQLKASIFFFRIVAKHSLSYLPDVFKIFNEIGYKTLKYNTLDNHIISFSVFRK